VSSTVLKGHKHIYVLGSGFAEIAAKEGALKIKELTYTHCQSLKLGSNIASSFYNYLTAHPETPMIFVILDSSSNMESDLKTLEIINQRVYQNNGHNKNAVVITDIKDVKILSTLAIFTNSEKNIHQIPKSGYLSALLSVIPMQRIAYDLTI
jgi:glucosamine 6-phosphate synthetase-like amidotransferase/phosphosugar isomerase protein